jgi:hypothetical protein
MNGADRPVLSNGRRNRQRAALLEHKEPDDLVADKAVPSDGQSNRHGHTNRMMTTSPTLPRVGRNLSRIALGRVCAKWTTLGHVLPAVLPPIARTSRLESTARAGLFHEWNFAGTRTKVPFSPICSNNPNSCVAPNGATGGASYMPQTHGIFSFI